MNQEKQTTETSNAAHEESTVLIAKEHVGDNGTNVSKKDPTKEVESVEKDALPIKEETNLVMDNLENKTICDTDKVIKTEMEFRLPYEDKITQLPLTETTAVTSETLNLTKEEISDDVNIALHSSGDELVEKPETHKDHSKLVDVASPLHVVLLENIGQGDGISASPSVPGPSSISPPSPQMSVYHIKWIKWKDNKTAIITQNENGPCPLIAIMNVLILKGKVNLPPMIEMITAGQLMEYLGDCILDNAPKNISEGAQLNYEQNMHDAMAVLPKLQTGLDVNVKFTGVSDFEYTPECIIFDLLNIPLYHGWLVDPQTPLIVDAVGNASYNQLVEKIIRDKASTDADVVVAALNAESFLERTASQLTYHGLCELNAAIQEDELCVLFRNNHFSTVCKYKNELFQLVTDQGFLTECSVVWETLSSIDGDGQFVDSHFAIVPPKSSACSASSVPPSSVQQIDQDYLVALSLQEEHRRQEEQEVAWQEYKEKQLGIVENITDEELARRLQLEEQSQSQSQQLPAQRGQPVGSSNSERHSEGKKKSDCVIL